MSETACRKCGKRIAIPYKICCGALEYGPLCGDCASPIISIVGRNSMRKMSDSYNEDAPTFYITVIPLKYWPLRVCAVCGQTGTEITTIHGNWHEKCLFPGKD